MESRLQKTVDAFSTKKQVHGISFAISQPKSGFKWQGHAGNLQKHSSYFIASTTKLYVTAVLLQLFEKNILHIDDPITKYLSEDITRQLHVFKNHDYSSSLKIHQLMAHTSGLPDYFQAHTPGQKSLLQKITNNEDQKWSFAEAIHYTKQVKPLFAPGTANKAHYSDSNYQLLGKILENILEKELKVILQEYIFQPLNLTHTYLYTDPQDTRPMPIYYKDRTLNIPLAMSSFTADGGIVSTAEESLIFIESFFSGQLFNADILQNLYQWNPIFYPLQAGRGVLRFKLPWFATPFQTSPEFIGHSGLSGALAFYCPTYDMFIAGTINQLAYPSLSFRLMFKLAVQSAKSF